MRVEQIIAGTVVRKALLSRDGCYRCFPEGRKTHVVKLSTLDEVAAFLRADPRGGIRMTPTNGIIRKHIHIDGVPR